MSFPINQKFVDAIVERAKNSMMSLGEPEGSYDLSNYDHPTFESVATLLVTAHTEKYDLVSLACAMMQEVDYRLKHELDKARAYAVADKALLEHAMATIEQSEAEKAALRAEKEELLQELEAAIQGLDQYI